MKEGDGISFGDLWRVGDKIGYYMTFFVPLVGDAFSTADFFGGVDKGLGKIDASHGVAEFGHFKS